jgi:hypothetical protein
MQHDGSAVGSSDQPPTKSQTVTLGLDVRRPLSRTRRLSFAGGAGGMHVGTVSAIDGAAMQYVAPSGFGSARLDLGRTWAVSVDIRRDVHILEAVTRQSFVTTTSTLWAGGALGRRWSVTTNLSYAEGAADETQAGSFEMFGGTAQLQFRLVGWITTVATYSYYEHRLRDVAAVPAGFPPTIDRHSVRFGMSLWLPVFGMFPAGPQR